MSTVTEVILRLRAQADTTSGKQGLEQISAVATKTAISIKKIGDETRIVVGHATMQWRQYANSVEQANKAVDQQIDKTKRLSQVAGLNYGKGGAGSGGSGVAGLGFLGNFIGAGLVTSVAMQTISGAFKGITNLAHGGYAERGSFGMVESLLDSIKGRSAKERLSDRISVELESQRQYETSIFNADLAARIARNNLQLQNQSLFATSFDQTKLLANQRAELSLEYGNVSEQRANAATAFNKQFAGKWLVGEENARAVDAFQQIVNLREREKTLLEQMKAIDEKRVQTARSMAEVNKSNIIGFGMRTPDERMNLRFVAEKLNKGMMLSAEEEQFGMSDPMLRRKIEMLVGERTLPQYRDFVKLAGSPDEIKNFEQTYQRAQAQANGGPISLQSFVTLNEELLAKHIKNELQGLIKDIEITSKEIAKDAMNMQRANRYKEEDRNMTHKPWQ